MKIVKIAFLFLKITNIMKSLFALLGVKLESSGWETVTQALLKLNINTVDETN